MIKQKDFRTPPDFAQLEEEVLQFWDDDQTFEKSVENRPENNSFSFYDGPPFATGLPHYGHLMQSYIKDLIPRYQTMKGKRVRRVWGWDCHGLPIENLIEKELNLNSKRDIEAYGIAEFNEACRQRVLTYADEWETTIRRIGRWIDMKHAYKTMDASYMESVWWVFKTLWDKGLIYKSHKVMQVCPRCVTPLSNFEVTQGYKTVKDISAIAQFQLQGQKFLPEATEAVFLLAWTTTPWTLPGNTLLAVNPTLLYEVGKVEGQTGYFVLAKERVAEVMAEKTWHAIKEVPASELIGLHYEPLFSYFADFSPKAFQVVAADFVTTEEGTGIVHIAPAFGEDDYKLGESLGLPLLQHVTMEGQFTDEVSDFAGMEVKPKDNPQATDIEIIRYLAGQGKLFAKKKIEHSYPHCWRCDTPLLNYATDSWFVKVTAFKKELLENNEAIRWQPEHIKHGRFGKWLENVRDWAISRNRYWGAPLPVWQSDSGKFYCVGSIAELEKLSGQKVEDLHKHFVDKIEFDFEGEHYRRIPEVLDCWYESGSMPYGQLHYPFENQELFEKSFPAEFISEGQDQTRGWFYTLHVLATALTLEKSQPSSAYQNVMCTGLIMAEDGKKMSKRLQNYPEPKQILDRYGSDALRLYLLSSPVVKAETLNFSETDVANLRRRVFLIWWNVFAFYKSFVEKPNMQMEEFPADKQAKDLLDRWMLSRLESYRRQFEEYLDQSDVMRAARLLPPFVDELSTWYLRLSRDRFKAAADPEAAQVFYTVLRRSAILFAPLTVFFSELLYQNLQPGEKPAESVHLLDFPKATQWQDEKLETFMTQAQALVELGHALRKEKAVKARQPLAELILKTPQDIPEELKKLLAAELNVKKVSWQASDTIMVDYDFQLTESLLQEGEARELIRSIQGWRKAAGLAMDALVTAEVSHWPVAFQAEIERKTKTKLQKGEKNALLL